MTDDRITISLSLEDAWAINVMIQEYVENLDDCLDSEDENFFDEMQAIARGNRLISILENQLAPHSIKKI